MAAEIAAAINAWPVLKLPSGSAVGNTSTITARGNRAIKYCLMPNRFMYCVANLFPPSRSEKPTSPPVTIMMIE
ncbi:hypothetical protein D3C75_816190 [compost metagenome]